VDQGVVVLWMAAHFFGRPLNYIGYGGEGKQVRDLLHVEDLYRLLKIQLGCMKSLRGRIFNVGGGMENSVSLCELTALCRDITGNTVRIGSRKTPREGDVPFFVTDFSRVMQTTRWKPRFDIRRTLEDIHEWIRTHADTLEPILRP
jgi:CDP-paratose 2-epimerase